MHIAILFVKNQLYADSRELFHSAQDVARDAADDMAMLALLGCVRQRFWAHAQGERALLVCYI